ncbi:hypothetical protein Hamer_G012518 [Homarus americanus]|uniref:Uncharacterized protein n=1 Tax=Homarus americanus TaxID=6706 RepID=A0A8J5N0M9_HOMAM|nr:hypothetical protein Hamer_G012518 [Homarus americanus]
MNEAALEVAAGVNSTVAQITSALRLLVSAATAIVLDAEGQVSLQSFYQVTVIDIQCIRSSSVQLHLPTAVEL